MIGASYVFYAWWDPRFVVLLAGVSFLAQVGGLAVARQQDDRARRCTMAVCGGAHPRPARLLQVLRVLRPERDERVPHPWGCTCRVPLLQVILPVGISFFSFMAVAYIVDIYRRQFEPAPWIDAFLYLSFFPHLVAGPIVRPDELIPQLDDPPRPASRRRERAPPT